MKLDEAKATLRHAAERNKIEMDVHPTKDDFVKGNIPVLKKDKEGNILSYGKMEFSILYCDINPELKTRIAEFTYQNTHYTAHLTFNCDDKGIPVMHIEQIYSNKASPGSTEVEIKPLNHPAAIKIEKTFQERLNREKRHESDMQKVIDEIFMENTVRVLNALEMKIADSIRKNRIDHDLLSSQQRNMIHELYNMAIRYAQGYNSPLQVSEEELKKVDICTYQPRSILQNPINLQ